MENQNNNNDEISLIDLLAVLLRYKWIVIIITLLSVLCAILFIKFEPSVKLLKKNQVPDNKEFIYESNANIFIKETGVYYSKSSKIGNFAMWLVNSDLMIDSFVEKFILKEELDYVDEISFKEELKNVISCTFNDDNNVLTITIKGKNEKKSIEMLNYTLDLLESLLIEYNVLEELDVIQTKTMIISDDIENDSNMIPIIIVIGGFFISIFIVFFINGIKNIKDDSVAMKKLFPKKYSDKTKED